MVKNSFKKYYFYLRKNCKLIRILEGHYKNDRFIFVKTNEDFCDMVFYFYNGCKQRVFLIN